MLTALFGLVGVVIGAVVTGGVDLVLERRREARTVRTARKLLALELREARDFLLEYLNSQTWAAEPERVLSNEQWSEHRKTWAATEEPWRPVATAFLQIAEIRRRHSGTPLEAARSLSEADREAVSGAVHAIDSAMASLGEPQHARSRLTQDR